MLSQIYVVFKFICLVLFFGFLVFGIGVVILSFKSMLGCLHPIWEFLVQVLAKQHLNSSFLGQCLWDSRLNLYLSKGIPYWYQILVLATLFPIQFHVDMPENILENDPKGKCGRIAYILTLAWPSHNYCSHLVRGPTDGRTLSLSPVCNSTFQINKIKCVC